MLIYSKLISLLLNNRLLLNNLLLKTKPRTNQANQVYSERIKWSVVHNNMKNKKDWGV